MWQNLANIGRSGQAWRQRFEKLNIFEIIIIIILKNQTKVIVVKVDGPIMIYCIHYIVEQRVNGIQTYRQID